MTDYVIYFIAWLIGTTAGISIGLLIVMAWDKIDMKRPFFRRKS